MNISKRLAAAAFFVALSSVPLLAAEKAVVQGRTPATQTVAFDIFLPLQNRDQIEPLLAGLHDPSSSSSVSYTHL